MKFDDYIKRLDGKWVSLQTSAAVGPIISLAKLNVNPNDDFCIIISPYSVERQVIRISTITQITEWNDQAACNKLMEDLEKERQEERAALASGRTQI